MRNRQFYEEEYVNKERSVYDIAKTEHTYPNRITRELHKLGFTLRTKSEAQHAAIKHGRHRHPTKGEPRSPEVRIKISETMSEKWRNMSEKKRIKRSLLGKNRWKQLPRYKRKRFRIKGVKANLLASKKGSKLELYLFDELISRGYEIDFHSCPYQVFVDILLPRVNVAIQVDGPSHFLPIWGEEKLKRCEFIDALETNTLIEKGIRVIRVKNIAKTLSNAKKRGVLARILNVLESSEEFVEIEVV